MLPNGGIKEKALAARRAGIRTVILPDDNESGLEEMPQQVRDEMRFVPVTHMDRVLDMALLSDANTPDTVDRVPRRSRRRQSREKRVAMGRVRAHITVRGLVQGVYFRDSTRREARRVGVTGWVRNLPDGRVEAVLEGERDAVEQVIQWSYEGPAGAIVEGVDVDWRDYVGEFRSFEVVW